MDKFDCRAASVADISLLRQLLIDRRQRLGHGCWHIGDLTWRTFLMTIANPLEVTTRLWFAGGRLAGFAVFDPAAGDDAEFDAQIHPNAVGSGIEEEMLDWADENWETLRETRPQTRLIIEPGVYEDDTVLLNALNRRGWTTDGADHWLLLSSLHEPIGASALPPGWSTRPITGKDEIPQRAAVHRDAFHPSRVTNEQYLRLMGWPGYTPELDLVTVSPEGEFGSFCLGWLDPVNRVGEFEPVGTGSAFRRLGLAGAVIIEGLRRMQEAGATCAVIGPINADYRPAMSLYESLGFRRALKCNLYIKA